MPPNVPSVGTSYFKDLYPIAFNLTQDITDVAADKTFLAANCYNAQGVDLVSTDEDRVQKAELLILGDVENTYDGLNALDCTLATDNQFQWDLNGAGFTDLLNGTRASGQMNDNDWRCASKGASRAIPYLFDITSSLTDIDGKIGLLLKDAKSEQDGLNVTLHLYLSVLWRL